MYHYYHLITTSSSTTVLFILFSFLLSSSSSFSVVNADDSSSNCTTATYSSSTSETEDQLELFRILTITLAGVLGAILIIFFTMLIQFLCTASSRQRQAAKVALSAVACFPCYRKDFLSASGAEKHPEQLEANARDPRRAPCDPSIQISIVCIDVEAAAQLWEQCPASMESAVKALTMMTRKVICDHKAYEVKSLGDGWMIAVVSPVIAVKMAVDLMYKRNDNFDGLPSETEQELKMAYQAIGPSSDAAVEKNYDRGGSSSSSDSSTDPDGGRSRKRGRRRSSTYSEEDNIHGDDGNDDGRREKRKKNKNKNKQQRKRNAAESAFVTAYAPESRLQQLQMNQKFHTLQPGQRYGDHQMTNKNTTTGENDTSAAGNKNTDNNNHNNNNNNNNNNKSRLQQQNHRQSYNENNDVMILPPYDHEANLRLRAGIDVGYAQIVQQQETSEFDYSGDTVERACRLEKLAHGHQLLVSSKIVDEIKLMHGGKDLLEKIDFMFLDEIDAGGCTNAYTGRPLQVYQVNLKKDDFFIIYPPLRVARAREMNDPSVLVGSSSAAQVYDTTEEVMNNNSHHENGNNDSNSNRKSVAVDDDRNSPAIAVEDVDGENETHEQHNNHHLSEGDDSSSRTQSQTKSQKLLNGADLFNCDTVALTPSMTLNAASSGSFLLTPVGVNKNVGNSVISTPGEEGGTTSPETASAMTTKQQSSPSPTSTSSGDNNNNSNNNQNSSVISTEQLQAFATEFLFTSLSTVPRDMRHKTLSALLLSWGIKVPQSIAGTGQNTRQAMSMMSPKKKSELQAQEGMIALSQMSAKVLKVIRYNNNNSSNTTNSNNNLLSKVRSGILLNSNNHQHHLNISIQEAHSTAPSAKGSFHTMAGNSTNTLHVGDGQRTRRPSFLQYVSSSSAASHPLGGVGVDTSDNNHNSKSLVELGASGVASATNTQINHSNSRSGTPQHHQQMGVSPNNRKNSPENDSNNNSASAHTSGVIASLKLKKYDHESSNNENSSSGAKVVLLQSSFQ